jgi:hypothetical protein
MCATFLCFLVGSDILHFVGRRPQRSRLLVIEYDDAAAPTLLSLGNCFVRNVKRAVFRRFFAYSDNG